MGKVSIHILLDSDGLWKVRKNGSKKSIAIFKEKLQAIAFGKQIAESQQVNYFIHNEKGRMESKSLYRKIK
jgi:hypothetical protein